MMEVEGGIPKKPKFQPMAEFSSSEKFLYLTLDTFNVMYCNQY